MKRLLILTLAVLTAAVQAIPWFTIDWDYSPTISAGPGQSFTATGTVTWLVTNPAISWGGGPDGLNSIVEFDAPYYDLGLHAWLMTPANPGDTYTGILYRSKIKTDAPEGLHAGSLRLSRLGWEGTQVVPITVLVTPEPGAMTALGLGALAIIRRRRAK